MHNYTKEHTFIWDEISLPIAYSSDWKKAVKIVQRIAESQTVDTTKRAEREIEHLEQKYYLSKRAIEPMVFVTPTDNWIMLRGRYVVDARERRLVRNELAQSILDEIQKTPTLTIASQTLTISEAPRPARE